MGKWENNKIISKSKYVAVHSVSNTYSVFLKEASIRYLKITFIKDKKKPKKNPDAENKKRST